MSTPVGTRTGDQPEQPGGNESFWQAALTAGLPALDLVRDYRLPRDTPTAPRAQGGEPGQGETASLTLQLPLAIGDLAVEGSASPFPVLLAAFRVLLWRHTGQARLPILARCDDEDSTGAFACVSELAAGQTFPEVVRAETLALTAARAHRRAPASATPRFPATFRWSPGGAGAEARPPADLGLEICAAGADLTATWVFDSRLFEKDTIARIAGRFPVLLAEAVTDAAAAIDDLPVLSAADLAQLRPASAPRRSGPPDQLTIIDLFSRWVASRADAAAVHQPGRVRSYAGVDRLSRQVAGRLAGMELPPEARVGLVLHRTVDVPAMILGVLRAGLAIVPLDASSPAARNTAILEDAGAAVLIQDSRGVSLAPGPWQVLSVADMRQRSPAAMPGATETSRPDGLAYILYTSGSTGAPKGVEVSHASLANCLQATRALLSYPPGGRWVAVSRLAFDISLLELFTPLVSGGELVIATDEQARDGHALRSLLEMCGPDFMQATPATWQTLLESGWSGDRRMVTLSGGDVVSPALAKELIESSRAFWHTYGPTETTLHCICTPLASAAGYDLLPLGDPIANMRVRVLDDKLKPVPPGVIGELCVSGVGLARGYLNQPRLTAERFVTEPPDGERLYRTGDLAVLRPDGRLELHGRRDGLVKIRGFRIEVGEVEGVLARHPAVAAAAVVRAGNSPESYHLAAYLQLTGAGTPPRAGSPAVTEPGPDRVSTADIAAYAARYLPDYMLPVSYQVVARLPMSANGKLDRAALTKADGRATGGTEFAAQTEEEAGVAAIWQDLLQPDRLCGTEDFFDIGGNSLLAVRMVRKLRERFGIELSTWMIYEAPTIPGLADLVREARRARREKD
jgi:amino acid adenylation domain-containing protein